MSEPNTVCAGNSLQISTQALAKIARCAALEVEGVAEVSCGGQKKVRDILEMVSIQQPVVVAIHDGTAEVTVHVMVAFGTKVPAMAEKVQKNVKSAIQNMTGSLTGIVCDGAKYGCALKLSAAAGMAIESARA